MLAGVHTSVQRSALLAQGDLLSHPQAAPVTPRCERSCSQASREGGQARAALPQPTASTAFVWPPETGEAASPALLVQQWGSRHPLRAPKPLGSPKPAGEGRATLKDWGLPPFLQQVQCS